MAYREFYKRQEIITPDYSEIGQGISNLFTGIAQNEKNKRTAADQFSYDLKGGFESDHKILKEVAKNVVDRVVKSGGRPDYETKKSMAEGKSFAELSEMQRVRAENLNKRIDDFGKQNLYYDPTSDYKNLLAASDPEVNFQTRGGVLDNVEKNLGNARNFKKEKYLADYVKDRQRSYKEVTTGNPDAKNTKYDQSTFWDDKTGKPGVTDEHAIDVLKSNPMLDERYSLEVEDQMGDEIVKMKASGDERANWMKGKSDIEIKNELINNPDKNLINNKTFGERKRDYAKRDLQKFNAIDSKVSYERKAPSGEGNVKNDAIGHSNTFQTNKTGMEGVNENVLGAHKISNIAGPGGILMIKKGISAGKPITIEADSQKAFDLRTGKNSSRSRGKFNLTGYQLAPFNKSGDLYQVQGNNIEELKKSIEEIPDHVLQNLEPELKVALSGYSLNDSKMLGDIATKAFDLSEQIGDETDPDKKADLEIQLAELNRLKQSFNAPGMFDEDIIQAAQKNGIKQVRNDQLLMANRSDLDKVKTITDGLDLSNQAQWSPEMKEVNELYKKRYQEAVNKKPEEKKKYPLPAGKPKVVKQGEFTYTWNELTGQYE